MFGYPIRCRPWGGGGGGYFLELPIASKKLNGHQALESMSLLGALTFSLETTNFIIVIITNKK